MRTGVRSRLRRVHGGPSRNRPVRLRTASLPSVEIPRSRRFWALVGGWRALASDEGAHLLAKPAIHTSTRTAVACCTGGHFMTPCARSERVANTDVLPTATIGRVPVPTVSAGRDQAASGGTLPRVQREYLRRYRSASGQGLRRSPGLGGGVAFTRTTAHPRRAASCSAASTNRLPRPLWR
jgi:hypothetical protein